MGEFNTVGLEDIIDAFSRREAATVEAVPKMLMALCGLPVKKVWEKVREFLAKYTDELPDTDELDGDRTTGNVEEHRTQER